MNTMANGIGAARYTYILRCRKNGKKNLYEFDLLLSIIKQKFYPFAFCTVAHDVFDVLFVQLVGMYAVCRFMYIRISYQKQTDLNAM